MEKLELYQLAKYLPYRLRIKLCKEQGFASDFLESINAETDCITTDRGFGCGIEECKPILRPMSDLIVERNGKIDLVELAKNSIR